MPAVDPREGKLPVWAQDLLLEARLRAALSWPTEPCPRPCVVFDTNGLVINGTAGDGEVWSVSGHDASLRKDFLKGSSLVANAQKNAWEGRRAEGKFWRSKADAQLAARWQLARQCARLLLAAGN